MANEIIKEQIEKLSCDLILADPEEPESLSGLLPVLKQIHGTCRKFSLKETAQMILQAKKLVKGLLDDDPEDSDENMTALNELVGEISSSITVLEQPGPDQNLDSDDNSSESVDDGAVKDETARQGDVKENSDSDSVSEPDQIKERLNELDVLVRGFCPGDVPDLGSMLNILATIIELSEINSFTVFQEIAVSCKKYMEKMILEDVHNIKPVEEGLVLLTSLINYEIKGEVFGFDYLDVLELLNLSPKELQKPEKTEQLLPDEEPEEVSGQEHKKDQPDKKEQKKADTQMGKPAGEAEKQEGEISLEKISPKKISDDDMEILVDFVSEARENLDSIEVNLIELEQDPENKGIINDIFRPFHTIKGVSGFLSLKKINKLSHTTENFLDSARNGDFVINDTATDVILESVDILKKLLDKIEEGTKTGYLPPDNDIDTRTLGDKLKKLQAALAGGESEPLGEMLVQKGDISSEDLDYALESQQENPDKKSGRILVDEQKAAPGQVASALVEQKQVQQKGRPKQAATQVKVSTRKLDDLVDYTGELVIAQSMLKQKTSDDSDLSQSVSQLGQIVTNMQTIAMSMRMIPIKATFMKMIRLVRDLSRKSGKEIALNMKGEDTEIDRNVVDALYEPMVHMIRNSCDHGVEEKTARLEQGKPAQGTITLCAYHKGGHIIIEIEDDGKGLDRSVILEKAASKDLISGNEQMTDAQVFDLIMQPGFSTAKEVTDVSGRGVGMDVVKTGIEKFRGRLNIESEKGKGSKFTISFPLTLAIIDGMLVKVGEERYVIPTMAIQKAFKPGKDEYYTVEGKGEMIKDRGNLIPLIRMHEIFHKTEEKNSIQESIVVVVESKDEKRALLVDALLGKDEYVIKSLGSSLENVQGLAGGAILGDGQVGLILDVDGIFKLVSSKGK